MPLPRFHIFKPKFPSGVNWGHHSASGLVFLCVFDGPVPIDLVSGVPGVGSGGPTFIDSQDGLSASLTSAGSQYFEWAHQPQYEVLGASSFLWRGQITTGGADRQFAGKHLTNGAANNPFDFRTSNAASPLPNIVRASSTHFRTYQNSTALTTGAWRTVSFTFADGTVTTTPKGMVNGVIGTITNIDGAGTGAVTGSSAALRVGRRPDNAVQMNGITSVLAIWNLEIPPGFMADIHENPFKMLRSSAWKSIANELADFSPALYARKRQHLNLVRR